MADQMMRIAGRSEDGLAKALKTNANGVLETKQIGGIQPYYHAGTEEITFVQGYKSGDTSITKQNDHIEIKTNNNPSAIAEISLVSDNMVDLTNIQDILLNFSLETTVAANIELFIIISKQKSLASSSSVFERKIRITANSTKPLINTTQNIDVTHVVGSYYLRFHIRDGSTSTSVPGTLKIHKLLANKFAGSVSVNSSGGLSVKDLAGKDVGLTAELDNDGKAVLRMFDAAPHAYIPETNSLSVEENTLEIIKVVDANVTIPGGGSLEILPTQSHKGFKSLMVVCRLISPALISNLRSLVEFRTSQTNNLIYSKEKPFDANDGFGNSVDFDIKFPRFGVVLKNQHASSEIVIQRYAVIGVR